MLAFEMQLQEIQLMKIDGACHCGKISYEAEVDPEGSRICHCTDCQTMGGSAFRMVVPSVGDGIRFTSDEPTIYVKIGESGNKRAQAFCANCGTHIYASPVGDGPKVFNIRTGTVRQRDQLPPKSQIWHRSAKPWLAGLAAIPKIEKQ
jgi:hypothetical protein